MQKQPIKFPHGKLCDPDAFKHPKLIAKSEQQSRPGYTNIKANEFVDHEACLKKKITLVAHLIKESTHTVVYTGAGISRASGIADYASKAKKSIAGKQDHSLNRLTARPTDAHYILTELQKKKYIKHWLQQNHDGLAQKSGYPTSKLNEIHGSWFDKKNPVVMMDDSLKDQNFKMLQEEQEKVDICLAIGTSLSGMRSDGIAKTAAQKGHLIIINLQQTPYDQHCSVRLYGNLQQIMVMLGKELGVKVPKERVCIDNRYQWNK